MAFSRLAVLAVLAPLLASHAAGQPTQPAQPAQLTIQLANFSIAPKPIQLAAGKAVTLTFENRAGGGHDFTAKEFFAASTITAGAAPGGKIELAAHETKSITLVPRAGTYGAHCSHFLHASMGMTDQIIVG
ncbi:MAG TPA: cupredoxin domain-containing protein [Sphingomicrobium sp.]|jgi:plastocyanin|nr:cupredoxin domain-containing protein [Sphingomicrobium sp.]